MSRAAGRRRGLSAPRQFAIGAGAMLATMLMLLAQPAPELPLAPVMPHAPA